LEAARRAGAYGNTVGGPSDRPAGDVIRRFDNHIGTCAGKILGVFRWGWLDGGGCVSISSTKDEGIGCRDRSPAAS
jgi:hypothetical protein